MQYIAAIGVGKEVVFDTIEIIRELASGGGSGRHTMSLGLPQEGDKVLFVAEAREGYSLLGIASKSFHCDTNHLFPGYKITSILAYDHWGDDTGGNANLVGGGIGQTNATISVESQPFRGFHFTITFFGRIVV